MPKRKKKKIKRKKRWGRMTGERERVNKVKQDSDIIRISYSSIRYYTS